MRTPTLTLMITIAAGGAIGALARHAVSLVLPHGSGTFPVATLVTNAVGCLLIGALMVVLTEASARPHRLSRRFLGVGVLGGFTTFSTYAVEVEQLLATGRPWLAAAYLSGTVITALAAVQLGILTTRVTIRALRRRGARR